MTVDFKTLLQSLERRQYAPVYLVDGEEPFYIDRITEAFEELLPAHERDFNLLVLYGKDTPWADVVNACRRFPMFAERQVVILKDAAQMDKDKLAELTPYLENPSPTTVFLIEHRFKKVDGRSKLSTVARKAPHVLWFSSEKVKDEKVPDWIEAHGREMGFPVPRREAELLTTFLGNDLQKIANEIAKVRINAPDAPALTPELIRQHIGASRDYNLFEFPETFTNGNADKRYRMLAHFAAHMKNAPFPLLLGTFYNHFARLYNACFVQGNADAAKIIGVPPFKVKETIGLAQQIGLRRIEDCLLLLADTSARYVGIDSNLDDRQLLLETAGRLEAALGI